MKIVWNGTFEIGAGTARSSAHGDIVCVRYSPRGAEGDPDTFKANVFPEMGRLNYCNSTPVIIDGW